MSVRDDASAEPSTYVTTWTRGADGAFNDLKKEKLATLLAGGKSIKDASEQVGIGYQTACEWAKNPAMKLRKKALRATPAVSQTFTVSIAMIVAELHQNATKAREDGDYSASNAALVNMYKISKAEKSLLETFDAKVSAKSGVSVVAALQAHLNRAQQLQADNAAVDSEGEDL
jgi:transposase